MFLAWLRNKMGAISTGNDWTADEITDLSGKVAVVTGATAGIGYEVTRELYEHGAKVYLACRDESKAVAAISSLERVLEGGSKGSGSLEFLPFDLTDLKSCQRAAQILIEKEKRLDIVVANAGIMGYPLTLINGIECQFYNHLGHHAFITPLLSLLRTTASSNPATAPSVRIAIVSSNAHQWSPKPTFTDPAFISTPFSSTFSRYGLSKLCNLLHVSSLSRDPLNSNLSILAIHPGPVNTTISRGTVQSYPWTKLITYIVPYFLLTVSEGSRTVLYAATSPGVDDRKLSGKYLVPYAHVEVPSVMARDEKLADELDELSTKLCSSI